tara:strand:+ start:1742 stop:2461 length:720 start_codon:yes stop_codon:yes gene_type:complete
MESKKFYKVFEKLPIIGMIHLAGANPVKRALKEIEIFEQEGINGAIIEDYHGSIDDVLNTMKELSKRDNNITLGINILSKPYSSFNIADRYGAQFVQFDSVQDNGLNIDLYNQKRKSFPNVIVLGGVGFKYQPSSKNTLEYDLKQGTQRCDAIVTTGSGTGIETPIEKLITYKEKLDNFPLIVGAGVNLENAYEQLNVADGVIVGSSLKIHNQALNHLDINKIKDFKDIVETVRAERYK